MTTLLMLLRNLVPATFMLWFVMAGMVVAFASAAIVDIQLPIRQLVKAGCTIGIIIIGLAAWAIWLTNRSKPDYSRNN